MSKSYFNIMFISPGKNNVNIHIHRFGAEAEFV